MHGLSQLLIWVIYITNKFIYKEHIYIYNQYLFVYNSTELVFPYLLYDSVSVTSSGGITFHVMD